MGPMITAACRVRAACGRGAGQRGAAALVVATMLFGAIALTALYVHRNLWLEQRSAANQYRAAQAFEAAEAGLEWALAQLNDGSRIGADCRPDAAAAAASFRERYLRVDAVGPGAAARFVPIAWTVAGVETALRPVCVRTADGWSCRCPVDGPPTFDLPAGTATTGAFALRFVAHGTPGLVDVVATGCTRLAGACAADPATTAEATATLRVTLGLVGALRSPPAATLTLRGAFDADAAPLVIRNADPATGLAIHAGTTIAAARARLSAPPGTSPAAALAGGDAALAGASAERYFAARFGLDKATWRGQPGVVRIGACGADCGTAIAAAVATRSEAALIWVDGDLALAGPLALGSAERPVLIVATGTARLDGAVALHGVLYAAALRWDHADAATGASLRGAALSESDYRGDGAPELVYDPVVLARLSGRSGSFARVNGSWRDF